MTFQSAKNLRLHLALIKAVENKPKIRPELSDSILLYWGQVIAFIHTWRRQLPHVTWHPKLLQGWVHALATQQDAQCSSALEGARWERHLKSTFLNISRATAAKYQSTSLNYLQEQLQRKGQLVLCLEVLEVSNWNQTREALSGLLSVCGEHLLTNHSQDTGRRLPPTPQQQSYSSELHLLFNNFTPRSRYMFVWSRSTAVTCKNESHLLRERWKCPIQLKSFGSENKNVQLF